MKLFKKIDIFVRHRKNGVWHYQCSTNQARTCRDAAARFREVNRVGGMPGNGEVRAWFAKD